VTMATLHDIHESLRLRAQVTDDMPCHIAAFSAWILSDNASLRRQVQRAIEFAGQARHPEHIAALGYGAAAGLLDAREVDVLRDEVSHLAGRDFFVPGRPLRIEADGIGLLGVALAAAAANAAGSWLRNLLTRASATGDLWQQGLIRAARLTAGEIGLRITPPDLAVALEAKHIGAAENSDPESAWMLAARLDSHNDGAARDAVRLTVFDQTLSRQAHVAIGGPGRDDLTTLLQNVGRSLKLWQYEDKARTPRSVPGRWEIENEYHVQALLWTVLAPVFGDLEDEENLPSIGHKHPRADLGIPSLCTIVEVRPNSITNCGLGSKPCVVCPRR
jgi:hypothetical protein